MPDLPYPGPPGSAGTPPDGHAGEQDPPGDGVAAEGAPAPEHCTVCGSELDPGQTYCLECGSPTKDAPRLRRGAGGLAVVALGLAVLGAGAGALAYVASQDDTGSPSEVTAPETSGVITVPSITMPTTETDSSLPGDTTGTLPMDTTYTTPGVDTTYTTPLPADPTASVPSGIYTETGPTGGQTTSEYPSPTIDPYPTDTSASSPGGSTGGSGDWPAGTSGWTAIVSSVRNESDARASASRLQSQGQPGGVLFSSDHPPLRPGYWVVFSGTYDSRSEALAQARALLARWPGAYPRQVDS
ncbi:MAG: SPOR domain-containing protein [Miltoncostaeaceae bacterium]